MKSCKHCGSSFCPVRPMQSVCSPICASRLVKTSKKQQRLFDKVQKEKLKTIPVLIKEAQVAFNAYIRARDEGKLCICCSKPLKLGGVGGGFDAGHYRSTGSASHLRFNEDNCHGQRKVCNQYGAGRAVDYRIGLIARIGLERVAALESNNQVHKWHADELRAIKAQYREKLKSIPKVAPEKSGCSPLAASAAQP